MLRERTPEGEGAAAPLSAGRIPELDAIRGLAALVVVCFHCWKTLPWLETAEPWTWLFRFTPLRLLTAGTAAVGVFFTLSGLVLALPMLHGRGEPYGRFLVKRFFRLYPPFAAAIMLAALLCALAGHGPVAGYSAWFNQSWPSAPDALTLGGHLLMLGQDRAMALDNVMWSLVHELRISLLFPLLVAAVLRHSRAMAMLSALLLAALSWPPLFDWIRAQLSIPGAWWPLATVLDTLRYTFYFVLGIGLAANLDTLVARCRGLPPVLHAAGWILAFGLLLTRFGPTGDGAWAVGAALLIVQCLGSGHARRFLRLAPLQWLGKVSYSLYLVHLPLLLALMRGVAATSQHGWMLLALPPLALLAAGIFHRLVEAPSQGLGRRLLPARGRLAGSKVRPA